MKNFLPEGSLLQTAENLAAMKSLATLKEAMANKTILESRVSMCDYEHNLIVEFPFMKGIIPRVEGAIGISDGKVRDIALISRVNRPVCFVVTNITVDSQGKPLAILSRREAQQMCFDNYISKLNVGDIINTKITHLEPFGAFCDIGCGIASLIPIDSISVSRIFHPSDRFAVGDNIKAVVKSREDNGRINLTHKELLGTWSENASLFSQGETVSGIVRTVESYGSFVELTPNLAGLAEPKDGVKPGQLASVYIKSILPDKMKVKLIIVDSFDGEVTKSNTEYFFNGEHMDYWQYSPDNCEREIATRF